MKCICCNSEITGLGITCSVDCGMAIRYLKKFNLSQESIQQIFSVKTNLSIKYKYAIWLKGFAEEPTCEICLSDLTKKKILSHAESSSVCSPECYAKLKKTRKQKQHNCLICSAINCKSQKCISTKRELSKYSDNLNHYIKKLNELYNIDEDLLFKNKLYLNKLTDYPVCVYCGEKHKNITQNYVKDFCSKECANAAKLHNKSYDELVQFYVNSGIPIEFVTSIDKHELSRIYSNKKRTIFQCNCGEYVVDKCSNNCANRQHFNNLLEFNEYGLRNFVSSGLFDIKAAMNHFKCSETTIRRMKAECNIQERCKNSIEDDIVKILKLSNTKRNDRTLIYPKELDMLCDTFAIEYDGLTWHSEGNSEHSQFDRKNLKYNHLEKTSLCEEKGVQLFHIFSNEWINKQEIWKSIVFNKIGLNKKIFARKCFIKEVDSKTANDFLEKNHMQGKASQSIRLGLFQNNELISLMTFGKSRYNKNVEYELIRFCTKLNTVVVGGASKLLKYFELTYNPKSIISYANRRWSQGNLYEKLGFEFINNTPPNYFYFKGGDDSILMSREQFQKHKLKGKLDNFDPKLTETENMYNHGYRKIYDCGNKVYIKQYI